MLGSPWSGRIGLMNARTVLSAGPAHGRRMRNRTVVQQAAVLGLLWPRNDYEAPSVVAAASAMPLSARDARRCCRLSPKGCALPA